VAGHEGRVHLGDLWPEGSTPVLVHWGLVQQDERGDGEQACGQGRVGAGVPSSEGGMKILLTVGKITCGIYTCMAVVCPRDG
jgi:hypothetical protein